MMLYALFANKPLLFKLDVMLTSLPISISIFLKVECSNPSILPEPGKRRLIEEPFVKVISYTLRYLLQLEIFIAFIRTMVK